jgi:orotidine-5'-phosphate decarboxylase
MPHSDSRLIVPLDFPNALMGLEMAQKLGDDVGFYKIGLEMLMGGGLALARELIDEYQKRIFLDMKLFDIGNTIEGAVRNLKDYGLDFLTVHGDPYVVRAAMEGKGGSDLKILAVTVLTSLDRADLDAAMIEPGDLHEIAVERARRALEAGADGVISSPHEAAAIRALPEAEGKLIVTPGVRPSWAEVNDQKRIMTPGEAIRAGADHIVIGRPITRAESPRQMAQAVLAELG